MTLAQKDAGWLQTSGLCINKNNTWGPFLGHLSAVTLSLNAIPPRSSPSPCRADGAPWQQSPLSTGLLWPGREMWRLSFVFNTSDLLCSKISPSREQMPHNGTASRPASAALHSPLAAVGEKAMQIILFQRSEQKRDL